MFFTVIFCLLTFNLYLFFHTTSVTWPELELKTHKGGVTLAAPTALACRLQSVPPTLYT
jgi:hypothetical protein